jgi:hypothetical protein
MSLADADLINGEAFEVFQLRLRKLPAQLALLDILDVFTPHPSRFGLCLLHAEGAPWKGSLGCLIQVQDVSADPVEYVNSG